MIVNGNYYPSAKDASYTAETNSVEALGSHMTAKEQAPEKAGDTVDLSPEALAALKEYAPQALSVLGLDDENPVLEEVKEMAKEKYFHFGSKYLTIPETQDEMISALDVANRFMDALNSIGPDEIYQAVAEQNMISSDDFISQANKVGARELIYG